MKHEIHEIFVKHLKCIKMYRSRVYFDHNVYFFSVY